ncbi:G-protein coupled receptor 4-like [Amia ocellicauda]|uniref:G-protein coupled receptor 4-like n=1 Tax=Amia ocellicauda TaxID=2972642 RepID=UPI0034649C0B
MSNCVNFSAEQIFLPVLYGSVFCVGLPANCLALYGLYRLIKAEYALPVYVIHLLLGDLLQIVTLPLWVDYYSQGHEWRFGDATCRLASYAYATSLYSSVLFMCCIALERYLAIVHPLWFQSQPMLKFAHMLCLVLWVLIVGTQAVGYHVGFERTHNETLCLETYPKDHKFAIFQLIVMPFTFLLPVLLFSCLSLSIHRRFQRDSFMSPRKKKRVMHLLVLVLLIYVMIFGPYHILGFIHCIGTLTVQDRCQYESSVFLYGRITMGILSLNPVVDPIIYIFLRNDVRETLVPLPLFQRLVSSRSRGGSTVDDQGQRMSGSGSDKPEGGQSA